MTTEDGEGRRKVRPSGKVKVWDEVTIRVGVGEYDFIRFTHGQERFAANNPTAIARAERAMHASVLEIVEARITEFQSIIEEAQGK